MRKVVAQAFVMVVTFLLPGGAWAQRPELIVQTGHRSTVNSVVFSPDGKTLASGSDDHTIKLWEVATGRELRTLMGHGSPVNSVALSSDGKTMASGGRDNIVRLWDVASGQELHHWYEENPLSVAFSPDDKTLASGSQNGAIKLWEVATGKSLRTLTARGAAVSAIAFSVEGKTLASGGDDKTIRLWDVLTGRELGPLAGHQAAVRSVAFSPDGKTLASGGEDKTIKLWEVFGGHQPRTLTGHENVVNSVTFSRDGKMLASGSADGTIKLWDAKGRATRTLTDPEILDGHAVPVNAVSFSPEGKTLASGRRIGTIKLWEAATGREVRGLTGSGWVLRPLAYSSDGKTLASSGNNDRINLWASATGQVLRTLEGHRSYVMTAAFSPDGLTLASASTDGTIKLWEMASGRTLRTLEHGATVWTVVFSPDGKRLASGGMDKTIRLWEVTSGRPVGSLIGHTETVRSVAFSPDGKTLASGGFDQKTKLWEVETAKEKYTLERTGGGLAAFSPDGLKLASPSFGNSIKLWEVASGHELPPLKGNTNVTSVAWSGDGKLLASASYDKTIKLWEVASGRELGTLTGHKDAVRSVAFSKDGKLLVSESDDQTSGFWEVSTGKLLARVFLLHPKDWVVIDGEGRFDGSPGGMKHLHYAVGTTTIALNDLKERYWMPSLWAKAHGNEPLRDVKAFTDVQLAPEIELQPIAPNSTILPIKLTSRGGGIGRVQVLVNGSELTDDARRLQPLDEKAVEAVLKIDLQNAANYEAGRKNKVSVKAWNTEGYVSNASLETEWFAPGLPEKEDPRFYAIVCGVSQYSAPPELKMNLRYPAQDAREIATALQLGATRWRGANKVKITLLTSEAAKSATTPASQLRELALTKANFCQAIEDVAQVARPEDILVLYLSGHGVSLQLDKDEYGYLTAEALTMDKNKLSTDKQLREQIVITGSELAEWVTKKIKANRRVMILDTCEAGAVANVLTQAKDLASDQIRALDRMQGRTGFHVLMGAAGNRFSYEAVPFEQGLLTYALLKGMKGAGLKEGRFVDISKLFSFTQDEVISLAKQINTQQMPQVLANAGATFDIGIITTEDSQKIALKQMKPFLLTPTLMNQGTASDDLKLGRALQERLLTAWEKKELDAVYLQAEEFAGAIKPSGMYTVSANDITLRLVFVRDERTVKEVSLMGKKNDIAGLLEKVMLEVKTALLVIPSSTEKATPIK